MAGREASSCWLLLDPGLQQRALSHPDQPDQAGLAWQGEAFLRVLGLSSWAYVGGSHGTFESWPAAWLLGVHLAGRERLEFGTDGQVVAGRR